MAWNLLESPEGDLYEHADGTLVTDEDGAPCCCQGGGTGGPCCLGLAGCAPVGSLMDFTAQASGRWFRDRDLTGNGVGELLFNFDVQFAGTLQASVPPATAPCLFTSTNAANPTYEQLIGTYFENIGGGFPPVEWDVVAALDLVVNFGANVGPGPQFSTNGCNPISGDPWAACLGSQLPGNIAYIVADLRIGERRTGSGDALTFTYASSSSPVFRSWQGILNQSLFGAELYWVGEPRPAAAPFNMSLTNPRTTNPFPQCAAATGVTGAIDFTSFLAGNPTFEFDGDLDVQIQVGECNGGESAQPLPTTCPRCRAALDPSRRECPVCGLCNGCGG